MVKCWVECAPGEYCNLERGLLAGTYVVRCGSGRVRVIEKYEDGYATEVREFDRCTGRCTAWIRYPIGSWSIEDGLKASVIAYDEEDGSILNHSVDELTDLEWKVVDGEGVPAEIPKLPGR